MLFVDLQAKKSTTSNFADPSASSESNMVLKTVDSAWSNWLNTNIPNVLVLHMVSSIEVCFSLPSPELIRLNNGLMNLGLKMVIKSN